MKNSTQFKDNSKILKLSDFFCTFKIFLNRKTLNLICFVSLIGWRHINDNQFGHVVSFVHSWWWDLLVRVSWRIFMIIGDCLACHQFFSREFLDYGCCIAISKHVVGCSDAISLSFERIFWNFHSKVQLKNYLHKPIDSKQ